MAKERVRIVARKALTVEALRERLKTEMARAHQRACPTCSGSGLVTGPLTAAEVMHGSGISSSAFNGFIKQGKSISLEAGLKLLAYLDNLEAPGPGPYTGDAPRHPDARLVEREQGRQARAAVSDAAAKAGVEAINRPAVIGR